MAKRRGRKPNILGKAGGTAPGKLTPQGHAGTAGHKEAVKQAQLAVRRQKSWELFTRQGLTMAQIAGIHGISNFAVSQDVHHVLDELKKTSLQTAADWRHAQAETLAAQKRVLLPLLYGSLQGKRVTTIRKGKKVSVLVPADPEAEARIRLMAADRLLRIEERHARLFGYDAPIKVTPTDISGDRPYQTMSLDELEAALAEKERLLVGQAIDVTPSGNGRALSGGNGGRSKE